MRRLALLTTLVLGVSTRTAAQADPYHPRDDRPRYEERSGDRIDRRADERRYHARRFDNRMRSTRPHVGGWDMITDDTALQGVQTIGLAQTGAIYGRLRIQAAQGRPYIRRIELLYIDGTRQVLEPHQGLNANGTNSVIDFDLNAGDRPLRQITIYSAPSRWSRYAVFGQEY
jgi:hypothetical protein